MTKIKKQARAELKKALPVIVKLLNDPKFVQRAVDAGYQFDVSVVFDAARDCGFFPEIKLRKV